MRSLVFLLAVLSAAPASAQDTWTDPFPGVRRLHRRTANQNINALVVDLCHAGVSVRTTADGERRRTPASFGELVGAQAAVNGDFFSYSTYSTDGLAAHGGAVWPGTADHGYVGPVAFGPGRAEIVPHEVVAGPEPWMREIVSGHPTILVDGTIRDHSGDPLCANRHPRTVLGLSADRARLFLAVIDGRASSRIGMTCVEEAQLMQELGASDAVNMDGGGSSAMWLAGAGTVGRPSDGSARVVANHLAVLARGSGEATHCPNLAPRGYLDAAACDGARGWAQDPDAPDATIDVHVYFGGPAGHPDAVGRSTTADVHRDDLCDALGSCAHGFVARPPRRLMDGVEREVFAYGIDSEGGRNTQLVGSPATLRCDPPPLPDGVLRHVTRPEVLAAWGLSFDDVAPVGDPALAARDEGRAWPAEIQLIRVTGEPAVHVIDGAYLRHVPSPEVMDAWGFDFADVRDVDPAEIEALEPGPPWRAEPFLARGDGPAVYVVDAADPASVAPDAGPIAPPRDASTALDAGAPPDAATAGGDLTSGCATAPGDRPTPWPLAVLALLAWRRQDAKRRVGQGDATLD